MSDRRLTPQVLLAGYASGIFPMADSRDDPDVFWVRPEQRGVFPIGAFKLSRSLKRKITKSAPKVRIDTCFEEVVAACANRETTWINDEIFKSYVKLFNMGYAHSLEVFDAEGTLWGGVYGVTIGGAFFGESMFSAKTDGSKIALAYLMARLSYSGFKLFDTQFLTDHLASLGAIEISRKDYEDQLVSALETEADFAALPQDVPFHSITHLITQTS
ncbi:MAG: leucyl/phenylalanyl-tRNA--protein transferase [Pseudomonadota bacterium]